MFDERSAYPHPDEFKVMRPEYTDPEEGAGDVVAAITIAPFRVSGRSSTRPGARRAALYEAAKTYRNYHPGYRVESPFPDEFEDENGTQWRHLPEHQRAKLGGDYSFEDEEGEDYASVEQMLMWDVRPTAPIEEDGEE